MSHVNLGAGELVVVARVFELKVELLCHVDHQNLHVGFGQSFAKADTVSSMERNPAHRVTLFTSRCQAEWACVVKPLWEKFHWTLPLSRVLTQALEVNYQQIIFFESVLSKTNLLGCDIVLAAGNWWSHTQPFLHHSSRELYLLRSLKCDYLIKECRL